MLRSLRRKVARLVTHPRPFRLLAARALSRSGLCRGRIIERPNFRLHFSPTILAAAYWAYPEEWIEDERTIEALLRPGDTYVDVGANIGTLTLVASKAVGPQGKVYAIEAHPRTVSFLRENVALNGCRNVTAIHCAVGAQPGTLMMSDTTRDDRNYIVSDGRIAVEVKTLDELIATPLDLLKIDVEGYELPVLRGATEVLKRCSAVYFEIFRELLKRYEHHPSDVLDLLKAAGFSIFTLEGRRAMAVATDFEAPHCVNLLAVRDPAWLTSRGFSVTA